MYQETADAFETVEIAPADGGAPVSLTKDAAHLSILLLSASDDVVSAPVSVALDSVTSARAAELLEVLASRLDEMEARPTRLFESVAQEHCRRLGVDEALRLASAAKMLDSKGLAGVAFARLAEHVAHCGSADKVCAHFQIKCDLTTEGRADAMNEVPWTTVPATGGQPLVEAGLLRDAVDGVFQACAPSVLLWLKGVSSGWRDRLREILCDVEWAERHGLQAGWAVGAQAL